jgi:hypothetical protein
MKATAKRSGRVRDERDANGKKQLSSLRLARPSSLQSASYDSETLACWLPPRALRLQAQCVESVGGSGVHNLALYIRYQTTRERAFHRSLKEL